jgi:hypothetical protein
MWESPDECSPPITRGANLYGFAGGHTVFGRSRTCTRAAGFLPGPHIACAAATVVAGGCHRDLPRAQIKTILTLLIDIVVQFAVVGHQRCIQEIWYEPARKRALASRA